jgi:hypothetical protein
VWAVRAAEIPSCTVLDADWPSQSPYVTAIGTPSWVPVVVIFFASCELTFGAHVVALLGAGSTIITPVSGPICYQRSPIDCLNNPLGEIVVSVDQVRLSFDPNHHKCSLITHPPSAGVQGLFWTTGGGFSNISSRAPYQDQVVRNYLKHTNIPFPATGVWNPNGRGYPDVAAVGHSTRAAAFSSSL